VVLLGLAAPAAADPDPEGGSASLYDQLDSANRGYLEASAKLENAQKIQQELTARLTTIELEYARRSAEIGQMAASAYKAGPLLSVTTLLVGSDPGETMDQLALLGAISSRDAARLAELTATSKDIARTKAGIEAQIGEQAKARDEMAARKRAAEKAIGSSQTAGLIPVGSPSAQPAPRNADGSWPAETCSIDDPTTSGCITPRTLHALQQAQAAGYTRYVSCYRAGTSGEHPKGRACDFSATAGGFKDASATGADKTYGTNLAGYFLSNADRLGVLYVIWYRQIWMPSTGWRAYSGGGTPASDHTNHVHLSVI
jgi:hypothetical protein